MTPAFCREMKARSARKWTMTAKYPTTGPRPHRRFRRLVQLFVLGLIVADLIAMLVGYLRYRDRQQLAAVIAETDRLDPGWRLADLLASRPPLSDAENGAMRLLGADEYRQNEWIPFNLDVYLGTVAPCETLLPERAKELRAKLAAKEPAIVEARQMADLPRGRFPTDWLSNPLVAKVPDEQVRSVIHLLMFDVDRRLTDGDLDGALISCRAAIRGSQYIAEEPSLLAFLVRGGCQAATLIRIERILAQGQAGDAALKSTQALLQDEASRPVLFETLRGERATTDFIFDQLDRDLLNREEFEQMSNVRSVRNWKTGFPSLDDFVASLRVNWSMGSVPAARARILEYHTQFLAIAKLPPEDQSEPLNRLAARLAGESALVRAFAAPIPKIADANWRTLARQRAAIALIAAERYRLRHGRWPDSLAQLTPDLLPRIPLDPFSKATLLYGKRDDGVVIYSVGYDAKDDGGDVDGDHPGTPGLDIGYRLWDLENRRQPAKAKPAEEKAP
jgi:hypothetical protein